MSDGIDLVYVILTKLYNGQISTMAICVGKEQYDQYVKTHCVKGTRTMVINPNHYKVDKFGDFMEKVYDSSYTIIDYYDDVPLTAYEEEMLIESESSFHQHMTSKVSEIKSTLRKDFIKFSKQEEKDIEHMLNIIQAKADYSIDEDEENEDEPIERINYKELLLYSGICN